MPLPSSSPVPGLYITTFLTPPAQVLCLLPGKAGADLQVSNLVLPQSPLLPTGLGLSSLTEGTLSDFLALSLGPSAASRTPTRPPRIPPSRLAAITSSRDPTHHRGNRAPRALKALQMEGWKTANICLILPATLPVPLTPLLPAVLGAAPSLVPAATAVAFCSARRGVGWDGNRPGTTRPRLD